MDTTEVAERSPEARVRLEQGGQRPGGFRVRASSDTSAPTYRRDIDGLRALAVILVVLFHAGADGFTGGFIGVDVFFVISGFLITGLIHNEIMEHRFSFVRFYERRVRRIIPALFWLVGLCFVAGWFVLLPQDYRSFAKSTLATVSFVSNVWFWHETENYFARPSEYAPLLHTWSLAVEEQFYIVFPILLLTLMRLLRARMVVITLTFICIVSVAASVLGAARGSPAAFYLAHSRAWELGIGALLALGVAPRIEMRWAREILAIGGLAAIVAAAILYRHATPFPGLAALAPCLGAAALIFTGGSTTGQKPTLPERMLSLRPVVFVGLISYSLYLWHWPILAFLRQIYGSVRLPASWTVVAMTAAIVAAVLSWWLVERPFRRRDRMSRGLIFAAGASSSIVLAVLAGLGASDAWPARERFPESVRAAVAAIQDDNPKTAKCFGVMPDRGLCRLGAAGDGPAAALFWGDSHANALVPGLDQVARDAGEVVEFAGLASCPPLVGFKFGSTEDQRRACARFNNAVMEELKRRSDISTVILTACWAQYAKEGKNAAPGPTFESAFLRTVEAIRASGRKVVVLGDVPEYRFDVPRKIIASERWGLPIPWMDRAAALDRNARARAAFNLVAQEPGVRVLSLIDVLCKPICALKHDGAPIYTDGDHITATAARSLLAPTLAEALREQARSDDGSASRR
jgi:peptidoglycan/LPS O-acetylase OafA/YrhL